MRKYASGIASVLSDTQHAVETIEGAIKRDESDVPSLAAPPKVGNKAPAIDGIAPNGSWKDQEVILPEFNRNFFLMLQEKFRVRLSEIGSQPFPARPVDQLFAADGRITDVQKGNRFQISRRCQCHHRTVVFDELPPVLPLVKPEAVPY